MVEYFFAHQIGFFIIGAIAFIIALLTLVAIAFLYRDMRQTKQDLRTFFGGKDAKMFEEIIRKNIASLKEMDHDIQELYDISNVIHDLAQKGTHKLAMIRFNPFKDLSGNQSFSIALLNGECTGVIISSLHTREGTRVYAKQIVDGVAPEHELTEEEKTVLAEASAQNIPTKKKSKR